MFLCKFSVFCEVWVLCEWWGSFCFKTFSEALMQLYTEVCKCLTRPFACQTWDCISCPTRRWPWLWPAACSANTVHHHNSFGLDCQNWIQIEPWMNESLLVEQRLLCQVKSSASLFIYLFLNLRLVWDFQVAVWNSFQGVLGMHLVQISHFGTSDLPAVLGS